jgi:hypothetical protein
LKTNNDFDAWFAASEHPQKVVMQAVRQSILGADERVEECVKWKTPTFTFKGNIASINPQAKQFVSLMFHRGAEIPGDYPSLSGSGNVARYMQFKDAAEVAALTPELQSIVRAWCELKQGAKK